MATICGFILALIQCQQNICNTPNCKRAANMIIENRNRGQDHCQNFYEYACAGFRVTHPITTTEEHHKMFDIQKHSLNQQIIALNERKTKKPHLLNIQDDPALPAIQSARAAYRDCLRTSQRSTAPIDCIQPIKDQFPRVLLYLLATPKIYAEREKVLKIAQYIQRAFINTIQNSWLDGNAKTATLDQLTNLSIMIGFTRDMILPGNLLNPYLSPYRLFSFSCSFDPINNLIFVPISALFYPSNQLGLEALNFAIVGLSMAHEMSHRFDKIGRRVGYWLTRNVEAVFLERSQCYEQQYNQFTLLGEQIGGLTLEENIADNVGLQLALDAYRLYVDENPPPEKKLIKFENYHHEKLFMLAMANKWCENVTQEYHVIDVRSGHAPAPDRVNGMIMNSRDFGHLWNCPPDSPMNPVHKCSLWSRDN